MEGRVLASLALHFWPRPALGRAIVCWLIFMCNLQAVWVNFYVMPLDIYILVPTHLHHHTGKHYQSRVHKKLTPIQKYLQQTLEPMEMDNMWTTLELRTGPSRNTFSWSKGQVIRVKAIQWLDLPRKSIGLAWSWSGRDSARVQAPAQCLPLKTHQWCPSQMVFINPHFRALTPVWCKKSKACSK
jgi:hypothetical protein